MERLPLVTTFQTNAAYKSTDNFPLLHDARLITVRSMGTESYLVLTCCPDNPKPSSLSWIRPLLQRYQLNNITNTFWATLHRLCAVRNASQMKNTTPSPIWPSVCHSGSNSHPTKSAILGSADARQSPFREGSMLGVAPLFTWGARADGFKMASRWWQRLDCSREGGFCVPPTPAVQLL